MTTSRSNKKVYSIRFLCIILAIFAFAMYANTLQNGYVLDDATVITNNTIVTKGFDGLNEIITTPRLKGFEGGRDEESYRPIPLITHAVEYGLFRESPGWNHFFNILFFATCVVAFFLFLNKLFEGKRTNVAFIAAILFALHPVHTEVVANIKSRDELLCFLFAFPALSNFIDYARSGKFGFVISGALCLLLALLSKETAISVLVIVPLIFFFYVSENKKRSITITIAAVVAAVLFFAARFAVLGMHTTNTIVFVSNPLISAPDLGTRIATAILGLGIYLKLLVLPYPLICDYSYNTIPLVGFGNPFVILSLVAYLGLVALAVYRLVKKPKDPWAFAILFFMITITMFSNIVFLVYSQLAERFLFFASISVCLAGALALERWVTKASDEGRTVVSRVLTFLLPVGIVFAALTLNRNADWKDNYTLFSEDVKKAPHNAKLNFLAGVTISQNMFPDETDPDRRAELDAESIAYLNTAIAIYPQLDGAHAELGRIYDRKQMFDSAALYNEKAIAVNPRNAIAIYNLGRAYYALKKYPEAIAQFRKTINIKPDYLFAHLNMARLYLDNKQYDSAIRYFNSSLVIAPEQQLASKGLSIALQKKAEAKAALNIKTDSLTVMVKPGASLVDTTHKR
jgi:tetratricopeptide (TPR) repeat protein